MHIKMHGYRAESQSSSICSRDEVPGRSTTFLILTLSIVNCSLDIHLPIHYIRICRSFCVSFSKKIVLLTSGSMLRCKVSKPIQKRNLTSINCSQEHFFNIFKEFLLVEQFMNTICICRINCVGCSLPTILRMG